MTAARIRRVASRPSISGILMSISTTSGRCLSAAATASRPSAASATTGMPAAPRISRKPPRTSVWSSATTTRGPGSVATLTAASPGIGAERAGPVRPAQPARPAGPKPQTLQRDPRPDPPAAARARARVQFAAVQADPLPQPDQSATVRTRSARRPRRPGTAVVGHGDQQVVRAVLQDDGRAGGSGVLDHVGQRLLHHPVRGQVDAGRQVARPGHGQLDAQPGGPDPLDQGRAPGRRRAAGRACPRPRRPERASQAGAAARSSRSGRSPRRPAGPPGPRPASWPARCGPRPPAPPSRSRCGSRRRAVRRRSGPAPPRPPAGSAPRARPRPGAAVRPNPRPAAATRASRRPRRRSATSTSSAVNRAGTCGVVSGNAAVAMTAPVPTASSAAQRNRL